jgi:hypothetical protein
MLSRDIEIKWSLRQNMWKVATGVFNTIQSTNVIICNGYHSHDSCPNTPDDQLILRPENKNGNKYVNDISVGDYAIVFASGEKSVLCVKITSEAYRKEIPEITVYKKWGHKNCYDSEEVEVCLTGQNTRKFTHTEIMVAYVRDVEVVGVLDYNEYYSIINKYKFLQTSIAQNRSEMRFVSL